MNLFTLPGIVFSSEIWQEVFYKTVVKFLGYDLNMNDSTYLYTLKITLIL